MRYNLSMFVSSGGDLFYHMMQKKQFSEDQSRYIKETVFMISSKVHKRNSFHNIKQGT